MGLRFAQEKPRFLRASPFSHMLRILHPTHVEYVEPLVTCRAIPQDFDQIALGSDYRPTVSFITLIMDTLSYCELTTQH
jgi:hypothetical protein